MENNGFVAIFAQNGYKFYINNRIIHPVKTKLETVTSRNKRIKTIIAQHAF